MDLTRHITAEGTDYTVDRAREHDIQDIVTLLRDDPLGSQRESANPQDYLAAFRQIDADPHQFLGVVKDDQGSMVGTMQLTVIPSLSRSASQRMLIEAVRIAADHRGSGLGSAMFAWVHEYARRRGVALVQLTTDRSRSDAQRFYERLGYVPSHIGYKLDLNNSPARRIELPAHTAPWDEVG
ncbi:GNAT family N-acetyltransferase [Kocuria sp.]|uniref:GNAT family N-acetyltransferase n=1 Tax=Kocuria sp. TaxID=1871328 RepID=UPI0026E09D99|nr:GNAT family N-acetyltransferase [Kocuria sp.]MDO5619412.1 GNAT family N-acetyltransferase [Kocuria sp.]